MGKGQGKEKKKKKKQQKKKKSGGHTHTQTAVHKAKKTSGPAIPPKIMGRQSNLTLQCIVDKKAPGWVHAEQILRARQSQQNKQPALQL